MEIFDIICLNLIVSISSKAKTQIHQCHVKESKCSSFGIVLTLGLIAHIMKLIKKMAFHGLISHIFPVYTIV